MAEAEALGYDRFGIWDSPALFREPWVTLASVARDTERIRLGTWVTNPVSRHPLVTGVRDGDARRPRSRPHLLGIGAGGTGVWHLGAREATLDTLRDYVRPIRGLLAAGQAAYGGADGAHASGVAASASRSSCRPTAPESLRLAGEIADGVVVGLGVTPEVVRGSLGAHRGGRRAGRPLAR